MAATAKRVKRLDKPLKSRMSDQEIVVLVNYGINASKERSYSLTPAQS